MSSETSIKNNLRLTSFETDSIVQSILQLIEKKDLTKIDLEKAINKFYDRDPKYALELLKISTEVTSPICAVVIVAVAPVPITAVTVASDDGVALTV
jgi:hypothetical protein